ncbi:MAG: DUF4395 family protein [Lacunisphaera sp.]
MTKINKFTRDNLNQQGFGQLDDEMKSRYVIPLRFSPIVGTLLVIVGLALKSPIWIGSMALIALSGVLFPRGMVIDVIYNLGVGKLFHAPVLPPTPKPRQFSYLLSTILLTASALSYHYSLTLLGLILGGIVVTGGAILSASLWCLGSWFLQVVLQACSIKETLKGRI